MNKTKICLPYDKFETLLNEKGVTAYQFSKDTGIVTSTFSDWKSKRSFPKVVKLYVIAKHLEVPMEYFIEEVEKPVKES